MRPDDIPGVVALQKACFPDPFPEELLWNADHLGRHLELFPAGQFVVEVEGVVAASASATRISEMRFQAHEGWDTTVGGPFLKTFDPEGSTLYGLDISVHPDFRRFGLGRRLYSARFELVRVGEFPAYVRYATGCRLPDFAASGLELEPYLDEVSRGERIDRTLTPLLRFGLTLVGGMREYMEDEESRNCAALLEWKP